MDNDENSKNKKGCSLNCDASLIKFKRKKIKARIRLGRKLLIFLVLSGVSGFFFSDLSIKIKYGKLIDKAIESEINNNDIILNYKDIIKVMSSSLVGISSSSEKLTSNTYYSENSTGIIFDSEGTIITNFSKVKDLENIYVKLSAQGVLPIKAEFIAGDEEIDIAIIKIKYDGVLTPVKLADNDDVSTGQEIAILSNSIGDDYIDNITPGIINSTNKKYVSGKESKEYNLLEISAPINNENTGGAISNSRGELIGIASLDITNKKNQEGVFYAVDLSELEEVVSSTTAFKSLLGLTGGSIVGDNNSDIKGFYVEKVKKGGNAYNAGIRPTDILFEIEGCNIINVEDMGKVLKNKKNGDTINCKVMRSGKVENINIVLDKF